MFTSGYDTAGSGFVFNSGIRFAKRKGGAIQGKPTKNFPRNIHMTDGHALKHFVPDYDPRLEFDYTHWELHVLAEKMLLEDEKASNEEPVYLSCNQLRMRQRREIYTGAGVLDDCVHTGLYWRTHPNGRPWNTPQRMRELTAGFYR